MCFHQTQCSHVINHVIVTDVSASALCADECSGTSLSALDVCVTSEDKRYFVSETDDISNLETSVLESPRDTQLWIKLAFKYLNQNET